jgi:hypothetical protein
MSRARTHEFLRIIGSTVVAVPLMAMPALAERPDLSNHAILGKMDIDDHYPFIAGMIEGIAYYRYKAGGKDSKAMNCVYDWFYEDKTALDQIYYSFGQFPDYPPASVIDALVSRKCGKP